MNPTRHPTIILLSCAIGLTLAAAAPEDTLPPHLQKPFGFEVTSGAAPGYIDDRACSVCHSGIYESYQEVGMARSFSRPSPENYVEDFGAEPWFHEPSATYYQIVRRGDGLVFRRFQSDLDGNPINEFEREVDWIVGSGNKARSYLYQTGSGELYQFPLGWYSEPGRWRMSPGYDKPDHDGITRQVRRECMFCHNAYPSVPAGSDGHWKPQVFPADLPEGTGCQRCHGPGGTHVRSALAGDAESDEIRAAIVNPGKLPVAQRDAVCNQCHLLPAVALIGARRLDRADYSFRPGEILNDYLVHVEIEEEEIASDERFEINHHAYRLRRSECFTESAGALTCITCHDPHRKLPERERAAHFSAVCLDCHERSALPERVAEHAASNDCASCHMPQRRTQDVVQVVMTDHRIQRDPGPSSERVARLAEREHTLREVRLYQPELAPSTVWRDSYLLLPTIRFQLTADLADRFARLVATSNDPNLLLDLARVQVLLNRNDAAHETLARILENDPDQFRARQWLASVLWRTGEIEEAEGMFRKAVALDDASPEIHYNLGLLLLERGKDAEARAALQKAVTLRENLAIGWYYLGVISTRDDETEEAIRHFQRALSIDPSHTRSYVALAEALVASDRTDDALRFLRHGVRVAADPDAIEASLEALTVQ